MYGLYATPKDAFRAPYDKTVESLFDGNHTGEEIGAALPRTSKELFTADFLDKIRNPTGELRRNLRVLDTTCDWRPQVPVHVFHSKADEDVPFKNAEHCVRQLAANGAAHKLTEVDEADSHSTTVVKALPEVVRDFHAVR
ncbi:hypothetical protein SMD44_08797 [Streptomyces alboflavus]|uniref:Peptidase S9 prolyl oligopeptidase catalytic domain-containing protein n=2 Tax=Streptomyces alboflavus TaxID=67267 RepID=A0A1Z1WSA0_9ACTN|nr:hypothetical protein [Streptomyces alboflavus]ARX89310.1 hypothetical protein SMD44_08797 [Streptomyces alboflavus]